MLTVLSPHVDDAAYAIAITLARAALNGETIEVVNCFTETTYAPELEYKPKVAISTLRAEEDARVVASLGSNSTSSFLGLPDTSARVGYDEVSESFHRRDFTAGEEQLQAALVAAFSAMKTRIPVGSPVFSPMGFGNHVDHRLVRAAAEEIFPLERLIYYEDMPYSKSAPRRVLRKHLDRPEFDSVLCPGSQAEIRNKEEALCSYASQLHPDHGRWILDRAKQLGGERLWLARQEYARLWC